MPIATVRVPSFIDDAKFAVGDRITFTGDTTEDIWVINGAKIALNQAGELEWFYCLNKAFKPSYHEFWHSSDDLVFHV